MLACSRFRVVVVLATRYPVSIACIARMRFFELTLPVVRTHSDGVSPFLLFHTNSQTIYQSKAHMVFLYTYILYVCVYSIAAVPVNKAKRLDFILLEWSGASVVRKLCIGFVLVAEKHSIRSGWEWVEYGSKHKPVWVCVCYLSASMYECASFGFWRWYGTIAAASSRVTGSSILVFRYPSRVFRVRAVISEATLARMCLVFRLEYRVRNTQTKLPLLHTYPLDYFFKGWNLLSFVSKGSFSSAFTQNKSSRRLSAVLHCSTTGSVGFVLE